MIKPHEIQPGDGIIINEKIRGVVVEASVIPALNIYQVKFITNEVYTGPITDEIVALRIIKENGE